MLGASRDLPDCEARSLNGPHGQRRRMSRAREEAQQGFGERIAYLAFSKGLYLNDVPAIAADTPLAFHWLMRRAIADEVAVVDASEMVSAKCQNFDVGNAESERDAAKRIETELRSLSGRYRYPQWMGRAPLRFTPGDVERNRWQRLRHFRRRVLQWQSGALPGDVPR